MFIENTIENRDPCRKAVCRLCNHAGAGRVTDRRDLARSQRLADSGPVAKEVALVSTQMWNESIAGSSDPP